MRLHCESCANDFDSDDEDPRCPTCLRKSSVVDPRKPRMGDAEPVAPSKPFLPRFAVAFPACSLLFYGMTFTMGSLSSEIGDRAGLRIYAALLGGLLLSAAMTLFQMPGMFASFGPRPPER